MDPLTVTRADLEAYQVFLVADYRSPKGKPLARTTASARISHLKSWYVWMMDRNLLVVDPARSLGIHVVASRVVRKAYLSLQEATALVQTQASQVVAARPGSATHAQAQRNLAAVCLALATGRRISGIAGLQVDQIDLLRRELRVEREKGHMGRVLPVAAWAMEVVGIYLREGRPYLTRGHASPWAFLDLSGTQPMQRIALRVMLRKLIAATICQNPDLLDLPGKHLTWHSLRVSFATLLFQNGCDIRSVNELLLHRCLSTTATYTPVPVEDLRQVFRSAHPRS